MNLPPDRRAALVAARASAAVRAAFDVALPAEQWGEHGLGGAAAVDAAGRAFVAPADDQPVALGAALAWALQQGADELHLLVAPADAPRSIGAVARRAAAFTPAPSVWELSDAGLVPVEPAAPDPLVHPPPATAEQVLLLEQAGVDVVVEEGEVMGELRGLEVARVVVDDDGSAHIEVGVGRFDREAFALLHSNLGSPEALARVVAEVAAVRRPGTEPHPINRIARERWLRHQLVESPDVVGAVELRPVDAARTRGGLREAGIAVALGARPDGTPLVAATSVGIDLEAVPDAADARLRHDPDADLVLVVPPRDEHPVTRSLAGRLTRPAEIVALAGEWPG